MTKTVVYALKILMCLALSGGVPLSAPAIARSAGIPASHAAKLLHYLALRGLARSRRGSHGGYTLQKSPDEIHVGQVIALFQVAETPLENSSDPLLAVQDELFGRVRESWEQLTIAELSRRAAGQAKLDTAGPGVESGTEINRNSIKPTGGKSI